MSDTVENMMKQLESITRKMDIPEFRCRKVSWLNRNMGIRNCEHPQYPEAMELVKKLLKMGVH